jgi:hypothetical protein
MARKRQIAHRDRDTVNLSAYVDKFHLSIGGSQLGGPLFGCLFQCFVNPAHSFLKGLSARVRRFVVTIRVKDAWRKNGPIAEHLQGGYGSENRQFQSEFDVAFRMQRFVAGCEQVQNSQAHNEASAKTATCKNYLIGERRFIRKARWVEDLELFALLLAF